MSAFVVGFLVVVAWLGAGLLIARGMGINNLERDDDDDAVRMRRPANVGRGVAPERPADA